MYTEKSVKGLKEVTADMVREFQIRELGYDFMAYPVFNNSNLSFHHTIVSHRKCKQDNLGSGYWKWNGSILVQDTSHDYLHVIERIDEDMFYAITSELVDMNMKGKLDVENLRYIHDILTCFEREHCGDRTRKGKSLIKEKYTRRVKL